MEPLHKDTPEMGTSPLISTMHGPGYIERCIKQPLIWGHLLWHFKLYQSPKSIRDSTVMTKNLILLTKHKLIGLQHLQVLPCTHVGVDPVHSPLDWHVWIASPLNRNPSLHLCVASEPSLLPLLFSTLPLLRLRASHTTADNVYSLIHSRYSTN